MLQPCFQPFPELKTGRLLLRQITMEDVEEIYFLRSDKTVLQFLDKEPAASLQEARDFIKRINQDIAANDAIYGGSLS